MPKVTRKSKSLPEDDPAQTQGHRVERTSAPQRPARTKESTKRTIKRSFDNPRLYSDGQQHAIDDAYTDGVDIFDIFPESDLFEPHLEIDRTDGGNAHATGHDIEAAQIDQSLPDSFIPLAERVADAGDEELHVQERVNRILRERRQSVPVAQVVSEDGRKRWLGNGRKRLAILSAGALLLVAVVVAVVLGVTLPPDKDPEESAPRSETLSPTTHQTAAPTPTPRPLIDLLISESFDGGKALNTPGTPQNEAYKWLLSDPWTGFGEYNDRKRVQRFALATFYFSTNGGNWTNNTYWLDGGDECDRWWQYSSANHLQCTETGALTDLKLAENNLQGTIPEEIALLSDSLRELRLSNNKLMGSFAESTGKLTNLVSLNLHTNQMTGAIPSSFENLTELETLELERNDFNGTIPTATGLLTNLLDLDLNSNKLKGAIPGEIAMLTDLHRFLIDRNELSGPIPTGIGRLIDLKIMALYNNSLSGAIPSEIAQLTILRELLLAENKLTGRLPAGIRGMTNLERLSLYSNAFTGSFTCPDFISKCLVSCPNEGDNACRTLF